MLAPANANDPAAADEAPVDPNLETAETIFRQGQAKYETADYAGAIELWTAAYALVGSSTENASIKALLIYNLAQAHLKAFDLDKDKIHLKQALQLLQSFRSNLSLLHEDQEQLATETTKVEARIAEIEGMLADLERPASEPTPVPAPTVEPAQDGGEADEDLRSGTPLIAAGGTVAGLGALLGVVGIVGGLMASNANDISDLAPDDLSGREDRFASGRAGNTMLIVGSVGAGVLVPTGLALVVVGVLRNKKIDRRSAALPRFVPSVSPSGGGLAISGRF
ncbi:hypothetical protein DB30_00541 [Enhygromyxa salina]|uniref:Tetratricopeptide repeat protein n=1 Tax=Enhygromyxa salina TaxID=215803 RepID=A0A0C2CPD7_9BACT|nr:hypothetical protein DB30_00541 [Enhygromyxa salina]